MKINTGQNLNQIKFTSTPRAKQEVTLGGGDGFQKSAIDGPLEADQLKSMKSGIKTDNLLPGIGIIVGSAILGGALNSPLITVGGVLAGVYVGTH